MKTCIRCGKVKASWAFYHHPEMADGTFNKCKDCAKADTKANYAANRQQKAEYERQREQQPERRAQKAEAQRRYRQRNPEKNRARARIRYALRTGKVKRQVCERCGNPETQAHHDDYSRPLDVRWLCFRCHREGEHGQQVN